MEARVLASKLEKAASLIERAVSSENFTQPVVANSRKKAKSASMQSHSPKNNNHSLVEAAIYKNVKVASYLDVVYDGYRKGAF